MCVWGGEGGDEWDVLKTLRADWRCVAMINFIFPIVIANIQERGNDHESTDSGDQSQDVKNDDTADATL